MSTNPSSARMRVVIIAPSGVGVIGGQEVESALLFRHWHGDPEVDVAFLPNNPASPIWLRKFEQIRYLRTVVRLPIFLWSVWRAASRANALHAFSASYGSFVLNCVPIWLISKLRGKAFVLNYHTARDWKRFASSRLAQSVLRRTERIVVPSPFLAAKFEEIGFPTCVVPNIIDEARFKYRPRNPLRPAAICTRNLGPDYGIEVVIEAFAIVLRHQPSATLYLIGDGPLRNKLESLVQALGLSGHVQFCGAMPNEKVAEWYERADIFVNASFLDNSPLSILEAMSSGVPVVTTAAGGIPSMVCHEGTALLCPVGNSRALAEQVVRLLREPELALNMAHRAHGELGMHHWALVRQKWLEVYGCHNPTPRDYSFSSQGQDRALQESKCSKRRTGIRLALYAPAGQAHPKLWRRASSTADIPS
jgi:glycosyltransferase involved in cell wall biosynthesis